MTMVETVGWVLVHFIWQGAAIAVLLAAALAATPSARAARRYALSCAALVLMLAATIVTAAGLSAQPPAIPSASPFGASAAHAPTTPPSNGPADRAPAGVAKMDGGAMTPLPAAAWRARLAERVDPVVERTVPWLVPAWIAGVSLLSIRLAGGWWRTRALRVDGVSTAPAWAEETCAMLCARLEVRRAVALVASVRVPVPVVLGHVKPVVIVPAAAFLGLTPVQLEAILAHELAHVRRHDYLVNLAQTVIETLLFYHPAVWWVSHQVRVAREHCCDDLAVSVCGSRRGYIHALLGLEELRAPHAMLALGATDGSLLNRARRLLGQSAPPSDAPRLAASAIALVVVAALAVPAFVSVERVDAALVAGLNGPAAAGEGVRPSGAAQGAQPTALVVSPDPGATLSSRWAWAEGAARKDRRPRYWIGYSIAPVPGLPPFVYFDRASRVLGNGITFGGHTLSHEISGLRFPGRPLAVPGGDSALKVLFNLDAGGNTPSLTEVHVSTLSLPVELRNQPVFWLGAAEPPQSLELVDRLYARAGTADLKEDLVAAAGVHDASPAVVAWLAARVGSGDADDVRATAAEWIAYHPIRGSVELLDRTARGDRASKVRQEAAEALGDLKLPEAAPALVALARELPDQEARLEAVEALGARSELLAHDALARIARQDRSTEVQREAVETLGDFQDQRGVSVLTELARTHPQVDVQREAIETLAGVMPPQTLVPFLEQLVGGSADARVHEEVVDTLAGIEGSEGLHAIKAFAESHAAADVRRRAVEALGSRASGHANAAEQAEIVELLSAVATKDAAADVRAEAVEALGEIDAPVALERLRELARTHPDDRVRAEAVETLGEARPSSAAVSLLKGIALGDRSLDVQHEAIETLSDLADGAGIGALVELAREHPAEAMRKRALEALLDSDHPKAREVFDRALGRAPRR